MTRTANRDPYQGDLYLAWEEKSVSQGPGQVETSAGRGSGPFSRRGGRAAERRRTALFERPPGNIRDTFVDAGSVRSRPDPALLPFGFLPSVPSSSRAPLFTSPPSKSLSDPSGSQLTETREQGLRRRSEDSPK